MSLRQDRLHHEWQLLSAISAVNPGRLDALEWLREPACDRFRFALLTPALLGLPAQLTIGQSHVLEFRFPRFFPAVPIEAYVERPVFHPNVDPQTGFICLWSRYSPADTVLEALHRIEAIFAWRMINHDETHRMQQSAADWRPSDTEPAVPLDAPPPLVEPPGWTGLRSAGARPAGSTRSRLTETE